MVFRGATIVLVVLVLLSVCQVSAKGKRDTKEKKNLKQATQTLKKETSAHETTYLKKTTGAKETSDVKKSPKIALRGTGTGLTGVKSPKVSKSSPKNQTSSVSLKEEKSHNTASSKTVKGSKNANVKLPKITSFNPAEVGKANKDSVKATNDLLGQSFAPTQSGTFGQNPNQGQSMNPSQASLTQSLNPAQSGALGQGVSSQMPGSFGQPLNAQNAFGLGQGMNNAYGNQPGQQPGQYQPSPVGQFGFGMQPDASQQQQPLLGASQAGLQQPMSGPLGFPTQMGMQPGVGQQSQQQQFPFPQQQGMPQQMQYNPMNQFDMQQGAMQQGAMQQGAMQQQPQFGAAGQIQPQPAYGQQTAIGMGGQYGQQQPTGQSAYTPNWYTPADQYSSSKQASGPIQAALPLNMKPGRRPKLPAKMKDILMPGSPPQTWRNPTCYYKGRYYTPGKVVEIKSKLKKVLVCVLTSENEPAIGSIPLSSLPCWPKLRE